MAIGDQLYPLTSYRMFILFQVSSCDKCQRNNYKLNKSCGELHPIPVKPKLWHQAGMDLIGPLTATPRGNKYIITITDYFSKWAEAGPLPDKTAGGIAKFFYSMVSIHNKIPIMVGAAWGLFLSRLTTPPQGCSKQGGVVTLEFDLQC